MRGRGWAEDRSRNSPPKSAPAGSAPRICRSARVPCSARLATARLLIASQAPGTKVHETGLSFNDPSGDRLRDWLQMDRDTFYDESRIAIVPMGLCYPGRLPNGGDAPPRPECAPLWRDRLLALMPEIRLTLLVGTYALTHVLGRGAMTEQVRDFRAHLPRYFAAAASVLAHHRLGAPQSLVRRGGAAGIARGCGRQRSATYDVEIAPVGLPAHLDWKRGFTTKTQGTKARFVPSCLCGEPYAFVLSRR